MVSVSVERPGSTATGRVSPKPVPVPPAVVVAIRYKAVWGAGANCRTVVLVWFGRLYFAFPGAVTMLLGEGGPKESPRGFATPVSLFR